MFPWRSLYYVFVLHLIGGGILSVAEPSGTAKTYLDRLWHAARERREAVTANRAAAERKGETYVPTNAESFASLIDYLRDKSTNPPLLSVEHNLVLLHTSVQELFTELHNLRAALNSCGFEKCAAGKEYTATALASGPPHMRPVQGPTYTIIHNSTKN